MHRLGRAGVCSALLFVLAAAPARAVDKDKAEYVAGPFESVPVGVEGTLSTADPAKLLFVADGGVGVAEVPWDRVLDVEYSQKVSGVFKRRQHFVAIAFRDAAGAERSLMLELGKGIVLAALDACEARTGRRAVYRDEDAASFRAKESRPFRLGS